MSVREGGGWSGPARARFSFPLFPCLGSDIRSARREAEPDPGLGVFSFLLFALNSLRSGDGSGLSGWVGAVSDKLGEGRFA
eukprot:g11986.t1